MVSHSLAASGGGAHPAHDLAATLPMECWSCTAHLKRVGSVPVERGAVASLYALTRASAEATAISYYLTEPGAHHRARQLGPAPTAACPGVRWGAAAIGRTAANSP